jgi:hypothetical protein
MITLNEHNLKYLINKVFENILKENNQQEYVYIGTCVNSFDEDSNCINGLFSDINDFSYAWETAQEITPEEFWSNIDPNSDAYDEVRKMANDHEYPDEYRYNQEYDIYFGFMDEWIHYFFVRKQ